jgi:hypothetical protein
MTEVNPVETTPSPHTSPVANLNTNPQISWKHARAIGGASLLIALLQSLCTAVLTISAIRVAIGLTALAVAGGVYAPARGFHQDAIRIPMLILATAGAIINLAVLAWIRHLRSRPSAQWRRREPTPKQRRSERLQIVLAIVTLILVALETWTHPMVHRTGPPPVTVHRSATAPNTPTPRRISRDRLQPDVYHCYVNS